NIALEAIASFNLANLVLKTTSDRLSLQNSMQSEDKEVNEKILAKSSYFLSLLFSNCKATEKLVSEGFIDRLMEFFEWNIPNEEPSKTNGKLETNLKQPNDQKKQKAVTNKGNLVNNHFEFSETLNKEQTLTKTPELIQSTLKLLVSSINSGNKDHEKLATFFISHYINIMEGKGDKDELEIILKGLVKISSLGCIENDKIDQKDFFNIFLNKSIYEDIDNANINCLKILNNLLVKTEIIDVLDLKLFLKGISNLLRIENEENKKPLDLHRLDVAITIILNIIVYSDKKVNNTIKNSISEIVKYISINYWDSENYLSIKISKMLLQLTRNSIKTDLNRIFDSKLCIILIENFINYGNSEKLQILSEIIIIISGCPICCNRIINSGICEKINNKAYISSIGHFYYEKINLALKKTNLSLKFKEDLTLGPLDNINENPFYFFIENRWNFSSYNMEILPEISNEVSFIKNDENEVSIENILLENRLNESQNIQTLSKIC
ncbi:MAG: hypothetical protein MHPSP_002156, partial [Paramarteilia canceri]